jgi:hypothetical protein
MVGFCCPLTFHFKNLSSNSNGLTKNVEEFAFLPFVFIGHCLYTVIAIVLSKIY